MPGFLKRAVVSEVINDISVDRVLIDGETVLQKLERLAHPSGDNLDNDFELTDSRGEEDEDLEHFLRAPRNSIIGRFVEDGAGRQDGPSSVFYPFFSSHLSMPVKPGEQVWVFTDGSFSYWLTRVHEPLHVEDSNYTHGDRRGLPTIPPPTRIFDDEDVIVIDRVPKFPNGPEIENRDSDTPGFLTMNEGDFLATKINRGKMTLSSLDSYEMIVTGNMENDRIVFEPVPRFTKRPGDLVLQGSNNTLINLGTERGYGHDFRPGGFTSNSDPTENAKDFELAEGMGAIDIVAGRGRLHQGAETAGDKADPAGDFETRPRVIKNSRENFETDKNVGIEGADPYDGLGKIDLSEGDPDMRHDASRVYLSMKSTPDKVLGLTYPNVAAGPMNVPQPVEASDTKDSATVIIKSDEIRIVARKDDVNKINGSIKIVKEGTADDRAGDGRAVIMIQNNGTIMIDGPKIVIGSGAHTIGTAADNHGEGQQVALGLEAVEPLVLGNALGTVLTTLLQTFVDESSVFSLGTAPNALNPKVKAAIQAALTALGGSPHTPSSNVTLSKLAKTK